MTTQPLPASKKIVLYCIFYILDHYIFSGKYQVTHCIILCIELYFNEQTFVQTEVFSEKFYIVLSMFLLIGLTNIVGSVIRFLDFKKDEQELHLIVPDVPNRKQSSSWIYALQKVFILFYVSLNYFYVILYCVVCTILFF